jgi:hypothetical protein
MAPAAIATVNVKGLDETKALVAAASDALDALRKVAAKQITMNNHAHGPWMDKRIHALYEALRPFSETGA